MRNQIFYIICHPERRFYFFSRHDDAEAKQDELSEKYKEVQVQYKTLKSYHGTVWYAYKWNDDGTCCYVIQGRWKDIKNNKDYGYNIKKEILIPYEDYMKQFEEDEDSNTLHVPETGLF